MLFFKWFKRLETFSNSFKIDEGLAVSAVVVVVVVVKGKHRKVVVLVVVGKQRNVAVVVVVVKRTIVFRGRKSKFDFVLIKPDLGAKNQ